MDGYQQFGPNVILNLFCWIPQEFIPKVEQTIKTEILESYEWLDVYDPQL